MVDFKKGMVDKPLQAQLNSVFQKMDKSNQGSLDFANFKDYLYAVGLDFILTDYEEDVKQNLFNGNTSSTRVTFNQFQAFIDTMSIHEQTPEQFHTDLSLFDEDKNGEAQLEDIQRVLEAYSGMNATQIGDFIKTCYYGPHQDEGLREAKLSELKLPATFDIKKALGSLYNI